MSASSQTPQKLIVTGCARSGTTLLHSLMGYFKDVKVYKYAETLPAKLNARDLVGIAKKYIVIKRPQFSKDDERYFSLRDLIEQDYRVINIIRDGRDVLVSRHPDDPSRYWVSPERWMNAVRETLLHRDRPEMLVLKYEALVRAPESVMAAIANFLGVSHDPGYVEFYRNPSAREYLQAATMQGARPLSMDSVGNWRRSEHAERIERVMNEFGAELRDLLKRLDYAI